MDIRLKGTLDGIATAQKIHVRGRTPIVFLTANVDEATLTRAMAADPYGYLSKPFNENDLHRTIEVALHKHRAEERHRREAADALRASEEPFRVVVNAVKDFAILLLNGEGVVVSWNVGAERIEGYAAEEIIGRHFSIFYPGAATDILERARREGKAAEEGWLLRKDGSRYWAAVVLSGHTSGFSMIIRDISERRAFEEQLRSLSSRLISIQEEERKRIAREVHDELGQGLTALKLNVAALAQSLPPAAAETAARDIARINELIDDNIHAVRRIAGELRPTAIDDFGLTAAVQLATDNFQNQSGIECEVSIRPEEIEAPPAAAIVIYRILQEALTNVVRHANATRVDVRLRQDHRSIVLEVRDNGVGASEDQLTRSDALGLIGMRERASFIGGELRVEGVPGRGTIVSLRTPAGTEAAS
jgi:PAS domain S-box-containing protein